MLRYGTTDNASRAATVLAMNTIMPPPAQPTAPEAPPSLKLSISMSNLHKRQSELKLNNLANITNANTNANSSTGAFSIPSANSASNSSVNPAGSSMKRAPSLKFVLSNK